MENLNISVSRKIIEKRNKAGMSVNELAEKLGVLPEVMHQYEEGCSELLLSHLYKLAKIFSVSTDYFFEEFELEKAKKTERNEVSFSHQIDKELNILLIEDDLYDEMLITKAISSSGENVVLTCVKEGDKAIDFIEDMMAKSDKPRPDIILLDLNMPAVDGQNILRQLKKNHHFLDIPVIIITGSVNKDHLIESYKNQAAGFINKNFDIDDFIEKMHILIKYWKRVTILPNFAS